MTPKNYKAMIKSRRMKIIPKLFLSPSFEELFDMKFVRVHSMSHYVREVFQFLLNTFPWIAAGVLVPNATAYVALAALAGFYLQGSTRSVYPLHTKKLC